MTPSAAPSAESIVTDHFTWALLVEFVSGTIFISSPKRL
jgi:hypothetical protein